MAQSDTLKWFTEKVKPHLADEQAAALEAAIAKDEVAKVLNEGLMARSDYSRSMDKLRTEKEQWQAQANTELQGHVSQLEHWRQTKENEVNAELQRQIAARDAYWKAQLEGQGAEITDPPPSSAKPNGHANGNGNGTPKYITAEELDRREYEYSQIPAMQMQLAIKHHELFGNWPDLTSITDQAVKLNRQAAALNQRGPSLEQVWESMYKVPEKREELRQAEIQRKIDEGINAGVAKRMADQSLSQQTFTGRPGEPMSVIHQMMNAKRPDGTPVAIPQPTMQRSEAVQAAEEAWSSGRYTAKPSGQ